MRLCGMADENSVAHRLYLNHQLAIWHPFRSAGRVCVGGGKEASGCNPKLPAAVFICQRILICLFLVWIARVSQATAAPVCVYVRMYVGERGLPVACSSRGGVYPAARKNTARLHHSFSHFRTELFSSIFWYWNFIQELNGLFSIIYYYKLHLGCIVCN